MDPKSELSSKPIVGMLVVVIVALFVGGWLYVDSTRSDLQLQVNALSSQVAAQPAVKEASTKPAQPAKTKTYSDRVGSLEDVTFDYPSDWTVDREGGGVAGFYNSDGTKIASIECSTSAEDIGGITAGAQSSAIDIPEGSGYVFHYVIKKYPTSNWLAFIENEQPHSPSCLLSFIQSRLDETTYHTIVDSLTVAHR
jgi:hypothetical protein